MNKELLQERKKMIYDFICDELYVPMKAKEMAIVLNVPKSQRGELLEVLDALTADGKVEISGRGKYVKSEGKYLTGVFTIPCGGVNLATMWFIFSSIGASCLANTLTITIPNTIKNPIMNWGLLNIRRTSIFPFICIPLLISLVSSGGQ